MTVCWPAESWTVKKPAGGMGADPGTGRKGITKLQALAAALLVVHLQDQRVLIRQSQR